MVYLKWQTYAVLGLPEAEAKALAAKQGKVMEAYTLQVKINGVWITPPPGKEIPKVD